MLLWHWGWGCRFRARAKQVEQHPDHHADKHQDTYDDPANDQPLPLDRVTVLLGLPLFGPIRLLPRIRTGVAGLLAVRRRGRGVRLFAGIGHEVGIHFGCWIGLQTGRRGPRCGGRFLARRIRVHRVLALFAW